MKALKWLPLALAAALLALAAPADDAAPVIRDNDILNYLQDVISWRHAIVDGDLPPDNARAALLKDSLRHNSQKILRSVFDFAHAESAVLEAAPVSGSSGQENRHAKLYQKTQETQQHIETLQEQLDALAPGAGNSAQREKLSGELRVEKAHLELLQRFVTLFSTNGSNDSGLTGAINKLSYTILGDLQEPLPGATRPISAEQPAVQQEDDNVFGIMSDMLALARRKQAVDALTRQTAELKAETQNLMKAVRTSLQNSISEGNTLADAKIATDSRSIAGHRRDLDAWFAGYKKLSAAALPLGQANSLMDAGTGDLKEWDGILGHEWDRIFRRFVAKLGILGASLLVPFIFLAAAHRVIVRYVRDVNRVRQLNVVRQVVFVTLLVLVVFLNFFTEFGSFATYAGFLTAGIAVALQTVLVSLTAHFFFFGRFGVRAGDRVTIAGVTGDVIQVGMLRIYLMELIGDKDSLRPSGKIVAFPNSVLFSTTAFSKQVAGTSYTWDDLTFSIEPGSDFPLASRKILDVVNGVYGEYRGAIERQHASLEQSTHLSVAVPTPRSEMLVRDTGLVCEVHYPALIEEAPKIYEKLITRLVKAFEGDRDFRMILANPIKIIAAKP